jgi:S-adenosylhomocysteine hydrolase
METLSEVMDELDEMVLEVPVFYEEGEDEEAFQKRVQEYLKRRDQLIIKINSY